MQVGHDSPIARQTSARDRSHLLAVPPRPGRAPPLGAGPRLPGLLSKRILLEYSPGYECSADAARPPRAGAKPRLRPETRLRRVLRPGPAAAVQPGLRDAVPAGPGR